MLLDSLLTLIYATFINRVPDLTVEVLSPGSHNHDFKKKKEF